MSKVFTAVSVHAVRLHGQLPRQQDEHVRTRLAFLAQDRTLLADNGLSSLDHPVQLTRREVAKRRHLVRDFFQFVCIHSVTPLVFDRDPANLSVVNTAAATSARPATSQPWPPTNKAGTTTTSPISSGAMNR